MAFVQTRDRNLRPGAPGHVDPPRAALGRLRAAAFAALRLPRSPASHLLRHAYASEPLERRTLLSGSVIISELMYHASSQNPLDEWVEVYNKSAAPVNLA